jgi:hypothetical protein
MDRVEDKMKVAKQSCSPFKVADVAEVATCRKWAKTRDQGCNFKVARVHDVAIPPLLRGGAATLHYKRM